MRQYSAELSAALSDPLLAHGLAVSIDTVRRSDNVIRRFGWWTGRSTIDLDVPGFAPRSYWSALDTVEMDLIQAELGEQITSRRYRVSLTSFRDDFLAVTSDYDFAESAVGIDRIVRDPAQVGNYFVVPLVRGWVETLTATRGHGSTPNSVELSVVGKAEAVTWALEDRRFNQATLLRRGREVLVPSDVQLITSSQTIAIPAGTPAITTRLVGGGGGGSYYFDGGSELSPFCSPGGDGQPTTVQLDADGVIVAEWTAAGGAGAETCSNQPSPELSPLSPYGDGGPGTGNSTIKGDGGGAGQYVEVRAFDLTNINATGLSLIVSPGAAGSNASNVVGGAGAAEITFYSPSSSSDQFFQYAEIAPEVQRTW